MAHVFHELEQSRADLVIRPALRFRFVPFSGHDSAVICVRLSFASLSSSLSSQLITADYQPVSQPGKKAGDVDELEQFSWAFRFN